VQANKAGRPKERPASRGHYCAARADEPETKRTAFARRPCCANVQGSPNRTRPGRANCSPLPIVNTVRFAACARRDKRPQKRLPTRRTLHRRRVADCRARIGRQWACAIWLSSQRSAAQDRRSINAALPTGKHAQRSPAAADSCLPALARSASAKMPSPRGDNPAA